MIGLRETEPMRPDSLDVLHLGNDAIEEVADSAVQAELRGELPRMKYAPVHIAEATADLAQVTTLLADVIHAPLRKKCAVIEAVLASGRRLPEMSVRELLTLLQGVNT